MKILLTKDVSGLGRAGDVKQVSDGHARNFLIPRHLGLPATSSMLAKIQKEEAEHHAKVKKEQALSESLRLRLTGKVFATQAKAEKHNLFASLKPSEIVQAINAQAGLELTADQIILEKPVKSLGLHDLTIRLAPTALAKVQLDVKPV